ncbi:stage II sporulation protein M [Nesterenkonia marinintestina]|uniref:stage II sporulation protein M n=1 Tax=Nesterenkonia marinintestina TaxID=2979865 RepID=UPI0021C1E552|nr:stage II sporulation protein M [Nesterenkonia sp. GX14115]
MDTDAFVAVHQSEWDRLAALSDRRRLTAEEADELLRLYERTSTHLSMVQAVDPGGPLAAGLSSRLGRARTQLTGVGENVFVSVAYFFAQTLPAAFYRIRWLTVIVAVGFLITAVWYGQWLAGHPDVDVIVPAEVRQQYADEDFVNYYSEHPGSSFSAQVWTNNAWIAAQMVAFGVTGVWVPYVLFVNASGVGMAGGIMHEQGEAAAFWLNILPHGLMELTAVFVAAAAGLRIFWAWVAPGQSRRLTSLAREGRRLITVAVGLVLVLLISGLVEGFVTPSEVLPSWAKIGIGALVLAGYWAYTLILGGRAHRAGVTGDIGRYDAGAEELTA